MYLFRYLCMYIYGNTHSQPLLQNRIMDVYETWLGWSSHCPHMCLGFYQIRPRVDLRQDGVKESFKDIRLYFECCHSGSSFGQIFQGVDQGRGKKKGRGRASPLTKSSFRPNIHSNILVYCRWYCWHMYLFEYCHSGCLFFWLNCLLLVIRWAIKGPWASSYDWI